LDLMTRPPEASRDDPSLTCTIKAIPPALQRFMAERANATIVAVAEPSRASPACSVELPAPLNAMLWR
jgi:hypothetical protein